MGIRAAVLAAALEYAANHLWLRHVTGGAARHFLVCWANDLFAGAAILAWADLLLLWARRRPLPPAAGLALTLAAALVWELAAPLWKPSAVADPWDVAAYLAGGAVYLAVRALSVTWSQKAGPPVV